MNEKVLRNGKPHNELTAECLWYLDNLGFVMVGREVSIQIGETHIVVDMIVGRRDIGNIPVECGNINSLKSRISLLLSEYPFIYWYPMSGVLLRIEKELIEDFGHPVLAELKELHCLKCGFNWFPRVENPSACPQCKSTTWGKSRKGSEEARRDSIGSLKCDRCGHKWFSRIEHPKACPKCHSPYWDKKREGD